MRRGDMVTVVAPGDFGKPRPAVIVQSDVIDRSSSVVVCLLTTHCVDAPAVRITVEPAAANGLTRVSQIMVDKIVAVPVARIGKVIGRLDDETMLRLNRTLAFVVGLGE